MKRYSYLLAVALVLSGLVALIVSDQYKKSRIAAIPVFGVVPDFTLIESSGGTIGLKDLAGRVWVADFIFTRCAGTCPAMSAQMARLQAALPPMIPLVSITVDPAHDTTEVLAQYAKTYKASPGRWVFLTGPRDVLYDLCKNGFKLPVDDTIGTEAEPITHSSRFVLIDTQSRIRGFYDSTDEQAISNLARDAVLLLN